MPERSGDYFSWPALTDLFPWQQSGLKAGRTWPIAPDANVLSERWRRLSAASATERRALFVERPTGRKVRDTPPPLAGANPESSIQALEVTSSVPSRVRFAFRSLDRQYVIADSRVIDRPSPHLWRVTSARQVFMTTLLTGLLAVGPAAIATHLVPDLHHFRGSFGGKDVIPLWRDAACREPNVTAGLLDALAPALGRVEPEDLLAYAYALLQAPSYTLRFFEELEIPGPRIPIVRDADLFARGVSLGRRLVWLHTYGERFVPDGERAGRVPPGEARYVRPIGARADRFPRSHGYDAEKRELQVGEGVFAPVSPEVRAFSVSGLDVVGSWLDYRMRDGAGRRSSPLDDVRPTTWPEAYTEELLQLLWVVEHTVALVAELDRLLDDVASSDVFVASELPQPSERERAAPGES